MKKQPEEYSSDLFKRISEEKRQRILSVAVEEIAQNGYANANVNTIAKNAGISIGSLYKYFGTKDDLFMYIVHDASLIIQEHIGEVLKSQDPILTKIENLIRMAHGYSLEAPDLIRLYGVFTADNDEKRAEVISEILEGLTASAYRTLISRAQKNGEVRSDIAPGILAFMIDNQLMITQFSFANSYYSKRFKLFLDAKNDSYINVDEVINSMVLAIKSMLDVK